MTHVSGLATGTHVVTVCNTHNKSTISINPQACRSSAASEVDVSDRLWCFVHVTF